MQNVARVSWRSLRACLISERALLRRAGLIALAWVLGLSSASAQIDPIPRRLLHAGYNQPLEGKSPLSVYAFYLHNQTNFIREDWTLRAAVAPVWLDAELGWRRLAGENTDVGLILAGGGFAKTYNEIQLGEWEEDQTFTGHGFTVGAALYHRFNPEHILPLNGVLSLVADGNYFTRDDETADNFELPPDFVQPVLRAGLRLGGQEPDLRGRLAFEASAWYEGRWRADHGAYGFDGDRELEEFNHRYWGRLLARIASTNSAHDLDFSVTGGGATHADRLGSFRLGGMLPFANEFPLMIPGYFYQELTARSFILLSGKYSVGLSPESSWRATLLGAIARVDFLDGLEYPDKTHSGIGGGITWRSPRRDWIITAFYGYGFNALRDDHDRGGHMVGVVLQYDFLLEGGWDRYLAPGNFSQDVFRLFNR